MTTSATVLTLSHQYGSGGSLIAHDLGRRLNWAVWDKEIVRTIASQQHVPEEYVDTKDERVASFIERVVRSLGVGGFEAAYNIPPPLRLNNTQLVRLTRALIEDVAKKGQAIIVGRGGNFILAGWPEVLHIFVFAPLEVRVERVMRVEGLTHAEAEQRIAGMDRLRTDYVHTFYHAEWRDPIHYHLQVDSGAWGEEGTADIIAQALEHRP
jgi:cytidylate kinase